MDHLNIYVIVEHGRFLIDIFLIRRQLNYVPYSCYKASFNKSPTMFGDGPSNSGTSQFVLSEAVPRVGTNLLKFLDALT